MKSVFNLFLAVALPTALAFVPQKVHVATTNYWGMTSTSRADVRVFAEKEGSALNIIIAGAPASGKGTQCEMIKEKFGIVHLSTGDMLRAAVAAKTEVGVKAKDFMDSGKLVPDEVIIGIVGRQKRDFFLDHFLNMSMIVNLMECFCRCIITIISDQRSTCRKRLSNGRMVVGWFPTYRRTSQGSCRRWCLGRLFHFLGCS
jgi:hypothetical protein